MAIAIPVFTAQLDKSKAATEEANARGVYAEAVADYLSNGLTGSKTYTGKEIGDITYTASTENGNTWEVNLSKSNTSANKTKYEYGGDAIS